MSLLVGLTRLLSQIENPIALALPLMPSFLISLHSTNTTAFLLKVLLSYGPFQFQYLTGRWRSSREALEFPQRPIDLGDSPSPFMPAHFLDDSFSRELPWRQVLLLMFLVVKASTGEVWFSITWSYPVPVLKSCQGKPLTPCVCARACAWGGAVLISLRSVLSSRS